ncbi:MAG: response regulator [Proteobacteria bacterium]|nr:response regulator [Desulfocapsa sp.]MBU3945993.1 response regulator [Pseudomonadota bacterium]MCG2742574.1 response regulator [Desulfobacteraceae bacterium]MBU3983260.1 response regulator [Pseudomonadota bacterium]MBU4029965.1 response regulator [Pseudomonadota bacterium]
MNRDLSKVLYVDDEEINLINFRESLCDKFEIFTALSGEEALLVLEKEKDIALVVSDQRMPGMKGVDLLARALELAPYAERIIITGYTDPQDIIAAINEGHVYRYILKPWTEEDLQVTITHAVERHHLKQHNRELLEELNRKNMELEDRVRERTAQLAMTIETLAAKVEELEWTKYELKTLQGFLAICSYCKKIRDTDDTWVPIEEYLHRHADIMLTHGICHQCHAQVMKDLPAQIEKFLGKEK